MANNCEYDLRIKGSKEALELFENITTLEELKMLFDLPVNPLEGFTEKEYKDAQKKQVYENRDRIDAIAKYVADLLVKDVYRQIRGTGKAIRAGSHFVNEI